VLSGGFGHDLMTEAWKRDDAMTYIQIIDTMEHLVTIWSFLSPLWEFMENLSVVHCGKVLELMMFLMRCFGSSIRATM